MKSFYFNIAFIRFALRDQPLMSWIIRETGSMCQIKQFLVPSSLGTIPKNTHQRKRFGGKTPLEVLLEKTGVAISY